MSNDLDFLFKPIIMVTGFGPFANHPVNASWEAVKLLDKQEIENKHRCELVLIEIPVTYENVDEFVPALWETHTPKLMIHVGVSSIANELTLEVQAHKKGYQRLDYFDKCPANHVCTADGAVRIHTKLNVERICKEFNDASPEDSTRAVSSKDAGSATAGAVWKSRVHNSRMTQQILWVKASDVTVLVVDVGVANKCPPRTRPDLP
ncbi:pyroglutamyl-peptidase 1 isoform X3 [Bombyx mori]|uniref:pyroglutamyl-peptidase 1 isoform X3 n=1 Tax=Bombyx mori TaxID=7091 RepID=UPI002ED0A230